ncbi:oxygen-independent coproporphyrinogen III oxidase [Cypionkella aquatica]|uniref:Coproporphyrinogen-III oxidase n=1 Tax=Cypionkella aquatica TaxID=1756042 RepID=A0AA37TTC1_9RHOB|nr:oxygen-independent coproporphyrinogen III oxidase [Cypionkella aquatica]GLS85493.1 oxygen-independent coproporphyrinogen III oxidase [Cypionkella aquatica]
MTDYAQLTQLGLFDARVPRYTSYPTTPQFKPGVGPDSFARWISAIPPGAEISLYLHIPFCRRLCWFCACRTQGTQSDDPVRAYVETVRAEISLLRAHLPPGVQLSRLHWGGGTPTILAPDLIRSLAAEIFALAPLAAEGVFSVEIDPMEIDAPRLSALVAAGMNRASIGVQDFDPHIQATIGRVQPYETTLAVAKMIRAEGVASLNADILYGLPHQTPARISDSVQKLLTFAPDRVALYGYAHVPWMSRRQQMIPAESMPAPQDRLALFETAQAAFGAAGYAEIGIDHFARPTDSMAKAARMGQLRRNFQGYTDDPSPYLIGLGASSISRFPQGYAQNAAATGAYTKAIRAGKFATERGHVFVGDDRLRGRIIEALMCDFQVNRAEIQRDFRVAPAVIEALFLQAVRAFPEMLVLDDSGLSIPPAARPLTRMVARVFDAYDQTTAQHSAAV